MQCYHFFEPQRGPIPLIHIIPKICLFFSFWVKFVQRPEQAPGFLQLELTTEILCSSKPGKLTTKHLLNTLLKGGPCIFIGLLFATLALCEY